MKISWFAFRRTAPHVLYTTRRTSRAGIRRELPVDALATKIRLLREGRQNTADTVTKETPLEVSIAGTYSGGYYYAII